MSTLDSPAAIAAAVGASLEEFLAEKSADFTAISPDASDIGSALTAFTRGGKRIRPILLWWGHQLIAGTGGIADSSDPAEVAAGDADLAEVAPASGASRDLTEALTRAAGSLELLHAAALIHDDVIDHSDTRRGNPAVHRQFESLHDELDYSGSSADFGVASAIVVGDICLALSEELYERAQTVFASPRSAAEVRDRLRRDVMVGQFLDIRAEVMPLTDPRILERAWEVLSFKSAKYSVEQPLLLGAALAGATSEQLTEISRFGLPLGQAFQLRDDVLGIFGDSAATGKPAGDDIREGKRTVLIAESLRRLPAADAEVLADRLGRADLTDAEVAETVEMLRSSGGLDAVEAAIRAKHDEAIAVLRTWNGADGAIAIGDADFERLSGYADALSFRER